MSAHPESYGHWDHAQISELLYERDRLRAELAKHQESEFHPDWSMLEATRASLREHMEIIRGLRAELAFATQERNAYQDAVDVACEERDRLRAECLRLSHAEAEAMSVVLSLEGQLERLRAEVAECKKDAERYRFVRTADGVQITNEEARDPVKYDAAIDAALKEGS